MEVFMFIKAVFFSFSIIFWMNFNSKIKRAWIYLLSSIFLIAWVFFTWYWVSISNLFINIFLPMVVIFWLFGLRRIILNQR